MQQDRPVHLTPASVDWPAEYSVIDHPPDELWLAGRIALLALRPRVALVGTRSPTPYGEAQARRLAFTLAEHGVVIVSGLARGIDQAAHRAALDAGGATIAVLGSGLDRAWPAGPLTERIRSAGLLLTEYPPGTEPRRHHFPLRNRLISGLCAAVIVVEAAFASGSLITARWAIDQGRAVFAVPGRVDHPMARGCHRLLREGAEIAEGPADVLSALGLSSELPRASPGATKRSPSPLLTALEGETLTADELATRTERSLPAVLAELVRLELGGFVSRAPGGLFRLTERGA